MATSIFTCPFTAMHVGKIAFRPSLVLLCPRPSLSFDRYSFEVFLNDHANRATLSDSVHRSSVQPFSVIVLRRSFVLRNLAFSVSALCFLLHPSRADERMPDRW